MKKIIPFSKELVFKTQVSEITSISLEHHYEMEGDDLIAGYFVVSGEYKMTEASINREKFEYKIPFDIALDSRYDIDNMVVDIEDFTYAIINNEILKVDISLYVDGEILPEAKKIELKDEKEDVVEVNLDNDVILAKDIEPEISVDMEEERSEKMNSDVSESVKDETLETLSQEEKREVNTVSIFNNMEESETYASYHVYIVKEEDTIDTILNKYNITKEELANYNDITEIRPSDKLIIPSTNNG